MDNQDSYEKALFRIEREKNLTKNYTFPKELNTFFCVVKSEIIDPRNRSSVKCNIPTQEIAARRELIRLQKECIITIKACDKRAGTTILGFNEYLRACYEHLYSKQIQTNGYLQNSF